MNFLLLFDLNREGRKQRKKEDRLSLKERRKERTNLIEESEEEKHVF